MGVFSEQQVDIMSSLELEELRVKITELDTHLLSFLAKRQQFTNQVAETKIKN